MYSVVSDSDVPFVYSVVSASEVRLCTALYLLLRFLCVQRCVCF